MNWQELAGKIDHTNLNPQAKEKEILQLCEQADKNLFASVCIAPIYVSLAAKKLADSPVKICTVCGFPTGMIESAIKAQETSLAINQGADEIDMVLPIGLLKNGEYDRVFGDIKGVVKAASGRVVKVIIECCYLTNAEKEKAVELIIAAGAQFVKTSTGMGQGGATVADVLLLKKVAKNKVKIKAAGGIRDYKTALAMIEAGADRIGASAGLTILKEIKQQTGF